MFRRIMRRTKSLLNRLIKSIKKIFSVLRKKTITNIRKFAYRLLKLCLRIFYLIKRSYYLVKKYFKYIATVLYFWLVVLVAYSFVPDSIGVRLQSFFFTVWWMIWWMVAILFSFYIFLIQNISDKSWAGYFQLLWRDKLNENIFRIIILIAIWFFVVWININELSPIYLLVVSIILIALVFWLFFISFIRVFNKVSPANIVKIIVSDIKKNIKRTDSMINKAVYIEWVNLKAHGKEVDRKLLFDAVFLHMSYNYDYINLRIEFLFDFYEKLRSKKDYEMSLAILNQIYQIIDYYFQIRSNKIWIDYSIDSFLYVQSDAQRFLYPIFEKFISKIENLIIEKDLRWIRDSIKIYKNILIRSCDLQYDSILDTKYLLDRSNPVFNTWKYHLFGLSEIAIKNNNIEALYQLVLTYRELSSIIITNWYKGELESIYKELNKIITHWYLQSVNVVWQWWIDDYLFILMSLINSKEYFNYNPYCFKYFFEGTQDLLNIFISTPLIKILFWYFYFRGLNAISLDTHILDFNSLFEYLNPDIQDEEMVELLIEAFDQHRRFIRHLSDSWVNFVEIDRSQLASSIYYIIDYLFKIQPKFPNLKNEIDKQINRYIWQLSFFIYKEGEPRFKENAFFDKIIDILLLFWMKGIETKNKEIIEEALDYILKFTSSIKDGCESYYPFSEPRILLNACYIGMLLLKWWEKELFDSLKKKLLAFDEEHKTRWKLEESQLFAELRSFYTDRERSSIPAYSHPFRDSQDILLSDIQLDDIIKFIEALFDITWLKISSWIGFGF